MKPFVLPLTLSSVAAILCYLTAGNSLDLFFVGFLLATLLTAQLDGSWSTIVGLILPVAVCWWIPVHQGMCTIAQWCMCVLVLLSFAAMLVSIVRTLTGIPAPIARSLVTIAALAWLTWPIWFAHYLSAASVHFSILLHPLFAINHELVDLGIWTEQQGAYSLTNLGQDVPYQLPYSAWPAIGFHTAVAIVLLFVARLLTRASVTGHAE